MQECEKEWLEKYDIKTGRLSEQLSEQTYQWVKSNTERTNELIREQFKTNLTNTYFEIIDFIGEWCDIPEDYKKVIAIWIIGTYFHKNFDTFPYLFLNAMRGTGKTRLLRIISWLQKNGNGEVLTNPSDAVLFRTAQERGMILDEFESERSKEKQTMREYLNAGYKKGGIVYRMEKQKGTDGKEKQVAVGHPLYTPVAMANINGLEDVLSDRSITLVLERSMNMALVKKIEDFNTNEKLMKIKANLIKWCVELCSVWFTQKPLSRWNSYITSRYTTLLHTTHNTHNTTQLVTPDNDEEAWFLIDKTGIFGRNLELFFPLLVSSYLFNKSVFNEMLEIVSNLNKAKTEDEFAESKDISLIEFISLAERFRFEYVYSHELFSEFKNFIGNQGNDEESRWLNITWFGLALKRLKLINNKKRVAKGNLILLNVDKAKEKLRIFKIDDKKNEEAPHE